jgi:hypothetical protein
MELYKEIEAHFLTPAINIEEIADSEPGAYKEAKQIERFVTSGVTFLRDVFPNDRIRSLMGIAYDLIGRKVTPVAFGPNVPTLSMAAMRVGDDIKGIIFAPHNWITMIKANPLMQVGALVFVGSQVVDFYNDKLIGQSKNVQQRARAFEAEYLLTLRENSGEGWVPNEYQSEVMKEYPAGVLTESVQGLMYTPKPYSPLPTVGQHGEHWAQFHKR